MANVNLNYGHTVRISVFIFLLITGTHKLIIRHGLFNICKYGNYLQIDTMQLDDDNPTVYVMWFGTVADPKSN